MPLPSSILVVELLAFPGTVKLNVLIDVGGVPDQVPIDFLAADY